MPRRKRKLRGTWIPEWDAGTGDGTSFGGNTDLFIRLCNNRGQTATTPQDVAQPVYARRVIGSYCIKTVAVQADPCWVKLRLYTVKVATASEYYPDLFTAADAQVGHRAFLWERTFMQPGPVGTYSMLYYDDPFYTTIDWKGIAKLEAEDALELMVSCPDCGNDQLKYKGWLRTYIQYPGTRS